MSCDPVVTMTRSELRQLLSEVVTDALNAHDPPAPSALLDRHEIARALGVSARTVARLREAGMPVVWVIESPRFELADVMDWLRTNPEQAGRGGDKIGISASGATEPKSAVLSVVPARGLAHGLPPAKTTKRPSCLHGDHHELLHASTN